MSIIFKANKPHEFIDDGQNSIMVEQGNNETLYFRDVVNFESYLPTNKALCAFDSIILDAYFWLEKSFKEAKKTNDGRHRKP